MDDVWEFWKLDKDQESPKYEMKCSEILKSRTVSDGKDTPASDDIYARFDKQILSMEVSSQLKQALIERGEKLAELQEKTGRLEESSKSFAERAKELAKGQRNIWF